MVMLCKAFGAKVIFAPRSGHILDEAAKSSFTRKFLKRVIRKADIVICQGSSWQAFYGQYEPSKPEKFRLVRNWVDTDKYSRVFNARTENIPTGNGPVKLLYLAWIESFKGIGDLLDVFERLRKEGLNIEADVYGNGGMFDEINDRVNNQGLANVFRLKGWADETMKLKALREADIFILPSYREGMPNALIEAMASGLPCISSEVGGVADLITHKENGLIFNPGDQDKLYENINYLYASDKLRKIMGEKAHQFILDKCSVSFASGYFEDMINNI